MAKTHSFADRLTGRLALLAESAEVDKDLARRHFAAKYDSRLASLVAEGNGHAVVLSKLMEERDRLASLPAIDPRKLAAHEEAIYIIQEHLGLSKRESGRTLQEVMELLSAAANGYESQDHLQANLTEGLLLSVNTLAAKALAIPAGEYIIWATDPGQTVLVPTEEADRTGRATELAARRPEQYEVMTRDLLTNWNKLERVIGEAADVPMLPIKRKAKAGEGGRPELAADISNMHKSQEQIADELDVHPSTVSRYVGWRNKAGERKPSFDVMAKMYEKLGIQPVDLFGTGRRPPSSPGAEEREEEVAAQRRSQAKEE